MLQMRMPADVHRWLKVKAAAEGTTMKAIMLSMLDRLRKLERTDAIPTGEF